MYDGMQRGFRVLADNGKHGNQTVTRGDFMENVDTMGISWPS